MTGAGERSGVESREVALKAGYLHCIGGASGDMLLGALLDAGLPLEDLRAELAKLPVGGFSLEAEVVHRGVIRASLVTVTHGPSAAGAYTIRDFLGMVDGSALAAPVKDRAREVLMRIEEAETRVHGEGHALHELGDLDTIVDVVGVVAGFALLGIDRLYSSPLPCGWGVISTRKGPLPSPAPATMQLIHMSGAKVVPPRGPYLSAGELVTPTGAALITALADFDAPPMRVERMGYGAGSRDTEEIPNVLALWVGEAEERAATAHVSLLETNIDDSTPELLGHVQDVLMGCGALDAWFTPIQMKKNRPAATLSVICRPELESTLAGVMLKETSTLGVRVQSLRRFEAYREVIAVNTTLGRAAVKLKRVDGRVTGLSPEFEDCRQIALREGLPLQEVYRRVERDARAELGIS